MYQLCITVFTERLEQLVYPHPVPRGNMYSGPFWSQEVKLNQNNFIHPMQETLVVCSPSKVIIIIILKKKYIEYEWNKMKCHNMKKSALF